MTASDYPEVDLDDFNRRFGLRASNLMWFLGAGASAAAGIPTAQDMIWELKQLLFVSQRRVSSHVVADLSNPAVRSMIQGHIDGISLGPQDAADEYAKLFEATYPAEADRQAFLDAKVTGAKPSYGHLALATFMREGLTTAVWTSNFDPLIADACATIYGTTGRLTVVGLDAPDLAAQVLSSKRWPVEIKLHGDFRSRKLKNTSDELRHQDVRLRREFIKACQTYGLVVVGYSGRDDSIMDALIDAVGTPGAFPAGLFWLQHGDAPPLLRVDDLLRRAHAAKIEAALVRVQNFDETLRDLVRVTKPADTKALDAFMSDRRRWSAAPAPLGKRGWPVVRLNALPVVHYPNICRLVECDIGGHAQMREAIEKAGVDLISTRSKAGVLLFGSDASATEAFGSYPNFRLDVRTIETKRLRYDSAERGLLRTALTRALERTCALQGQHRRSADLLAPAAPNDQRWLSLQKIVGDVSGATDDPDLTWREGVAVRVGWANDAMWLLFEPRIIFSGMTDANRGLATDFARERTVKRYNRALNELIEYWSIMLSQQGAELQALGVTQGIDATFKLSSTTAYSRRVR